MPREKLSPEERERRRKERVAFSFTDGAYKHYDPTVDGFGSAEAWANAAGVFMGVRPDWSSMLGNDAPKPQPKAQAKPKAHPDLIALGLDELPADRHGLVRAYRAAVMKAHPDTGGSNAAFRAVNEAFERLKRRF